MTEIQEPTTDEHGAEVHPAFGKVLMNRSQVHPGASLFDSEILHQQVVTLRIEGATRNRDLNRDWIHPHKPIIEISMSEAQWASMVSSFHDGGGTSCTVTWTREDGQIPRLPFAPRLQQSMDEVRGAAQQTFAKIKEARDTYEAHKTAANLRALHFAIENATSSVTFAAKSLNEHAENVVQKARADIEAMVTARAEHLGLNASDTVAALELEGPSGG